MLGTEWRMWATTWQADRYSPNDSNTNFPEELRVDNFKVSGCQSQVWLIPEEKNEKVYFMSDSDALIAKGLVTLIASIYSDETPEDIINSEIDLMKSLNLE